MPGTLVSAFMTEKFSTAALLFTSMTFRFWGSPFGSKFPKLIDSGVTDTVGLMNPVI